MLFSGIEPASLRREMKARPTTLSPWFISFLKNDVFHHCLVLYFLRISTCLFFGLADGTKVEIHTMFIIILNYYRYNFEHVANIYFGTALV